jgi:transcriptional regulator with XRE-family HTH domain
MRQFGEIVRAARESRGETLTDLAARLRISKAYLSDIELGRRLPSVDRTGGRLAELLDVPVEVLYYSQGILPPDLPQDVTPQQITAAFAAMRRELES